MFLEKIVFFIFIFLSRSNIATMIESIDEEEDDGDDKI